ncbi:MAG: hypothetical protein D3906_13455 [Candidatus Electrothrix sp. AUS1_2]|nr:hypothetical protein [Candidatus Electrothrix sp. AUS1_2]
MIKRTLTPLIGVRIPVPQPSFLSFILSDNTHKILLFPVSSFDKKVHLPDLLIHKLDFLIHRLDFLIHSLDELIEPLDKLIHLADFLIHGLDRVPHLLPGVKTPGLFSCCPCRDAGPCCGLFFFSLDSPVAAQ